VNLYEPKACNSHARAEAAGAAFDITPTDRLAERIPSFNRAHDTARVRRDHTHLLGSNVAEQASDLMRLRATDPLPRTSPFRIGNATDIHGPGAVAGDAVLSNRALSDGQSPAGRFPMHRRHSGGPSGGAIASKPRHTKLTVSQPSNVLKLGAGRAAGQVMRKPGGATPPNTTQKRVEEAIALLSRIQPYTIHQALAKVTLGGSAQPVHSVPQKSGRKTVTNVFNLELKIAQLPPNVLAQFKGPVTPAISGGIRRFDMEILIATNVANSLPESIARRLHHEGMHMRLFIDRHVPEWDRSTHLGGLNAYLDTARKDPAYGNLITELAAAIHKAAKTTNLVAHEHALSMVEKIVEDKYAEDVMARAFLGSNAPPPISPTAKRRQYLSLTTRWLVTYLDEAGAKGMPYGKTASMASKLVLLWQKIDNEAPQPPLYPVPIGIYGSYGSENLPPLSLPRPVDIRQ